MGGAGLAIPADSVRAGWIAELDLVLARREGRTVLVQRRHRGPLVVQRPFHPGDDACHVYLLHPPGGIVGGDRLEIRVRAGAGAHVLLTTPAAGKFYRSAGPVAWQSTQINLESAVCEYLPQESIVFAGARARTSTVIRVDATSRCIGWEIACFGRPASAERFATGEILQVLELWREDEPLVIDRFRISGSDAEVMQGAWALGGHAVLGTLLAYPAGEAELAVVRERLNGAPATVRAAATLVDGALLVRALGPRTDFVRDLFVDVWQALRPGMLGREAVLPRVWAT